MHREHDSRWARITEKKSIWNQAFCPRQWEIPQQIKIELFLGEYCGEAGVRAVQVGHKELHSERPKKRFIYRKKSHPNWEKLQRTRNLLWGLRITWKIQIIYWKN